jgi:hypothetical protein
VPIASVLQEAFGCCGTSCKTLIPCLHSTAVPLRALSSCLYSKHATVDCPALCMCCGYAWLLHLQQACEQPLLCMRRVAMLRCLQLPEYFSWSYLESQSLPAQ